MDILHGILVFLTGVLAAEGVETGVFWTLGYSSYQDKIRSDGSQFTARSVQECAVQCTSSDQCLGFSHSNSLALCQLHSASDIDGLVSSLLSMKYYTLPAYLTTTTSTTTSTTTTTTLPITPAPPTLTSGSSSCEDDCEED